MTDAENNAFVTVIGKKETSWYNYNSRLEIWFNLDVDVMQVERSVYNYLTLIGDIGGLYGTLAYAAYLILCYLNYNKFENILA